MKLKALILSLICWLNLYGQDQKAQHIQQLLEFIQQEENDSEVQVNLWWHYLDHPIDISSIKQNQLEDLAFLSPIEIKNIILFCKTNAPILHTHELQYTPDLSEQSFLFLLPFIRIQNQSDQLNTKSTQELLFRFAQTFDNNQDSKQPEKLYTHFRSQHKWFRFGMQAEKDAGENWPQHGGFDYISAHLYIQHPKKDIQFAIGDYHVQMGQGLMLHQGYSNGIGGQITGIKRQDSRLKPYTGTNENDFFRGIATRWKHKKIIFSAFYSKRHRDARVYEDDEQVFFINFDNSGLHSTTAEIEKKDRIKEENYGLAIRWTSKKATLAWHYMNTNYNIPQNKSSVAFDISGKQFHNTAIDFSFDIKNHHFFGEWGYDFNKQAFLIGSLSPLGHQFSLALLYSRNDSGYHAPYAQLFNGQSTGSYDLYIGLRYELNSRLHFSFYHTTDSQSAENTEQQLFPNDQKFFCQLNYRKRRGWQSYLQYQSSIKQIATDGENNNTIPNKTLQRKLRWHTEISLNENWKFRWRIEYQYYEDELERLDDAWMVYQELKYKSLNSPLSFLVRYTLFDTEFNTRIYAYEQQVRYQFASAQFYGQGEQIYGLLHYKINQHYEVWLRYSNYNFLRKKEQMNQEQLTAQIRINL